ncbi:MAG: Fe-S protein assembly co-chaperone HscB [Saprospiraceae bacterium]
MSYFDFYKIPVTFLADEAALRKTYYANSKKYHPDFFTLSSEEEQAKALEMSTQNNEAFKTLSDPDQRMKYILELKGAIGEEGKNQIPQDFLMEMMDINEALMELEFDYDEAAHKKVIADLEAQEETLYQQILPILENYQEEDDLTAVAEYYFKKRYLLRIRENLEKLKTTHS